MTTPEPAAAFGANSWLVEEMYEQFRADPSSVGENWREFFEDYKPTAPQPVSAAPVAAAPAAVTPAAPTAPAAATAVTLLCSPRPGQQRWPSCMDSNCHGGTRLALF